MIKLLKTDGRGTKMKVSYFLENADEEELVFFRNSINERIREKRESKGKG